MVKDHVTCQVQVMMPYKKAWKGEQHSRTQVCKPCMFISSTVKTLTDGSGLLLGVLASQNEPSLCLVWIDLVIEANLSRKLRIIF
jgi:hypothetical protein